MSPSHQPKENNVRAVGCVCVLRGWQRSVTRRRSGASPCAMSRAPLPAAGCRAPQAPAWGLRAQIQPGLGLSLLLDVPTDHKAVTPYPCCPTKVLCQNGHSSWHLPVSLFFFPGALNVSTLILAHLSAEAPAYRPRHMFPQAT